MTIVAARTLDLRAEFEAQLRAVVRLEEQLLKSRAGYDAGGHRLAAVLRRELTEMLKNNTNIRDVLTQLEMDVGQAIT
jgi:hypothetical protein